MTAARSYRQLTCPDLCAWFIALHPGAYIAKDRDAHLFRKFIDDMAVLPTQLLEGMLFEEECASVPSLLRGVDNWLLEDVLMQEAELAIFLSAADPPPFYYDYADLRDTGIADAQQEAVWQRARAQLEKFTDDALNAIAVNPRHASIKKALARRAPKA